MGSRSVGWQMLTEFRIQIPLLSCSSEKPIWTTIRIASFSHCCLSQLQRSSVITFVIDTHMHLLQCVRANYSSFFLRRECMWLINQKEMTHFHTHGRAHKCRLRCLHIWSSGRLLAAYLSFTYNWIKPYSHSEYWWFKYALVNVSEGREELLCCVLSASVGYVCSFMCVCVERDSHQRKSDLKLTH